MNPVLLDKPRQGGSAQPCTAVVGDKGKIVTTLPEPAAQVVIKEKKNAPTDSKVR